jgi:hypothetical protein
MPVSNIVQALLRALSQSVSQIDERAHEVLLSKVRTYALKLEVRAIMLKFKMYSLLAEMGADI